jgi:hypothetical protein
MADVSAYLHRGDVQIAFPTAAEARLNARPGDWLELLLRDGTAQFAQVIEGPATLGEGVQFVLEPLARTGKRDA